MSQELIFTTLPNQRYTTDGKDFLKLSVFCSIRLTPAQESSLKNFPDISNWPEIIATTAFNFKFGSKVLKGQYQSQNLDPKFFGNIFYEQIRVKSFKQDDFSAKRIHTVPILHVKDFVLNNYRKIAIDSPTKLITADKFIDPDTFGSVNRMQLNEQEINKVNTGKNSKKVQLKTLISQNKTADTSYKAQLKKDQFIKPSDTMNPVRDFAQLRHFHRIDAPMKVLKPITLKKPEFEFHDILSITTNYPQIARRLGFVLDFLVPFDTSIPVNGTVQIILEDFNLSDDTSVISTPVTAYQLTSKGFYIADKPETYFKQGFVKINTPSFSVVQLDADGVAIKTQQIAESKTKEVARYYQARAERSSVKRIKRKVEKIQKIHTTPPVEEGLPAMRTAGIAIVKNGMAEHVFQRFQLAKKLQPKLLDLKMAQTIPVIKNNISQPQKIQHTLTLSPLRPTHLKPVNENLALKIINPVETLYSDDLIQGYRMDIAYENAPDKWYSLHQRKNVYTWYDKQNNPNPLEIQENDEGFIELAMTENPDDENDIFISETLARWEGWSLSVSRPGFALNEAADDPAPEKKDFIHTERKLEKKKYAFDPDIEFKMNMQSDIVPGTLPRLRFGMDYQVRVRTVDLAGNSVPLDFMPETTSDTIRKNIRYMRYEPLASPIVLVGNELKDGAFLESMVIRSNYDTTAYDYENKNLDEQKYPEYDQRFLLPPKNSQMMAETHSMFEKAMGNNPQAAKEIYDIITAHEGLYKRAEKTKEKIYQPSEVEVIYLPDPMAAGVALFLDEGNEATHSQEFKPKMFSFFSDKELTPDQTNEVAIPEDWYHAKALRIKLEEGDFNTRWDATQRIFTIFIPKGHRTKIRYSTFWREADFKKFSALWQMVTEKNPTNLSKLNDLAKSGQHWMMSPSRTFELVHAVQQPVEVPILQTIFPDRDFGETFVDLHTQFQVHGESTEKVVIQAKWVEPIDDGISVEINEEQAGRNMLPEIPVQYQDDTLTYGTIPENGVIPPHNQLVSIDKIQAIPVQKHVLKTETEFKKEPQPGAQKINTVYQVQNKAYTNLIQEKKVAPKNLFQTVKFDLAESKFDLIKQIEIRRDPLEHHFGDTKHRWVDYQMVATSRYQEYFDKIFKKNPELSANRESKWVEKINILSAARPQLPEIDYIIPTFEWRKEANKDQMTHRRMGGGLRIYLKRPWYSTGVDEMLGVVLPPDASSSRTVLTHMSTSGYTDYYTHWAIDPILYAAQTETVSPKTSDFRLNPVIDNGLSYPGNVNMKAKVAAYPVSFDSEKQVWYADIAIDPKNVYFPFIKLALARYQPYSVKKEQDDVCLSPVVLATFMQLVPERKATLNFVNQDKSNIQLKIEGTVFNERYAKWGNQTIIKISFLDTLLSKPLEGILDQGKTNKILDSKGKEIEIQQGTHIQNNKFVVQESFGLPANYKNTPYQILIEEFERGPLKSRTDNIATKYAPQMIQSEETDRLIYADVFTINAI